MPRRSSVLLLPAEVRAELDAKLASGTFRLADLVEALEDAGYTISRSALARYSQRLSRVHEQVRMTREAAEALRRDLADLADNDATECLIQMFQAMAHRAQVAALDKEEAESAQELTQFGRALRDMVAAQKHSADLRLKVSAQVRAALQRKAGAALDRIGQEADGRISADALRQIREEIYGVFADADAGAAP